MTKRILLLFGCLIIALNTLYAQNGKIGSSTGVRIGKTRNLKDYDPSYGKQNIVVRDRHGLLWNRGKRKSPDIKWDATARYLKEDPLRKGTGYNGLQILSNTKILSPEIAVNKEGMAAAEITPADPTLCVGPGHIIQMINGPSGAYFQVFNKTGEPMNNATYLDNLAEESGYSGAGDGICLYDQFADRYVMTEFGTPSGSSDINTLIVYVSQTNDPLQAWYIYKFTDASFFPDYPKFSVWPDAWYATSRDFTLPDNLFSGISFFAFNKQQMISGSSTVQMQRIRLNNVEKYDGAAPINVFGPTPPDPGSPGLFAYRNDDGRTVETDADSIALMAFDVDFDNPSNSSFYHAGSVPTSPFNTTICSDGGYFQACITTPGSNNKLMATTSFVMDKPVYRKFPTHESILVYHTVNAGSPGISGIRWHELRKTSGSWQLYQEGTYSPDTTHRFYPSMNMNGKGQIAAVYNSSSSTLWPSIRVTGRNASDPPGRLPADETNIVTGTGYGTFSSRWGDYNMIAPDPANDSLFWLTSMYGAPGGWKTRIASIKLAPNKNLDAKLSNILSPVSGQIFCDPSKVTTSIQIGNSGLQTLTSVKINWQINNGTIQSTNWTGSLAFGNVVTVALPVVVTGQGNFNLRIFLTEPNGGVDERTSNDSASVSFLIQPPVSGGITQGFELPGFPPAGWKILNPNAGSVSWTRTTLAQKSGTASAFMNLFNYNSINDEDFMISPGIRLLNTDSIFIRFSHAYKPYSNSATFADSLKLMASVDCGNSFTLLLWSKGGAELASTTGFTGDINWVPGTNEWAGNFIRIPTSTFGGAENVSFAWISINKFGQNIFVDDIQIEPYTLPNLDISVRQVEEPGTQLCNNTFSPVIDIRNNGKETINSFRINMLLNDGNIISRDLTGLTLTTGQIYQLRYDSLFALTSPGENNFVVYTTLPNGQPDQQKTNDTLARRVFLFTEVSAPLMEGFETTGFPPQNWDIFNPGNNNTWQPAAGASSEGQKSVMIRNFVNPVRGDVDELYTPPVKAGNADSVFLKFDLAYISAKPDGESTDTLQIWLSKDCGQSKTLLYSRWGAELQSVTDPNFPGTNEFVPVLDEHWRTDSIDLTNLVATNEPFQVIFRNSSNQNNNLYLDNINLYTVTLPAKLKSDGYLVAPNPTPGHFLVRHYRDQENLRKIEVINSLGQLVWTQSFNGNASSTIPVDISKHAAGIYVVRLVYEDSVRNTKILKTNR